MTDQLAHLLRRATFGPTPDDRAEVRRLGVAGWLDRQLSPASIDDAACAGHGTDHGHGNAMLLLGGGVRGGRTYAKWPTLAPSALVAGDLAATSDYRSVIGEVLQKRCGIGSLGAVFPSVTSSSFGLVSAR